MLSKSWMTGCMYYSLVSYSVAKRETTFVCKAVWDASEAAVLAFATKWDEFYPEADMPCDSSIMCLREGKRHKADCPLNANYHEDCPKERRFRCYRVHQEVS